MDDKKPNKKNQTASSFKCWWWVFWGIGAVVLICVLYACLLCFYFTPSQTDFLDRVGVVSALVDFTEGNVPIDVSKCIEESQWIEIGTFGDMFGALNTFFTGCAFVGLLITIHLQRYEMKETREEFEEQTKQLENQTKILNEQLEEQKTFNRAQLQLSIDTQHIDELFKRLEIINKVKNEICVSQVYATRCQLGLSYKESELRGEPGVELLFSYCQDFFCAINSNRVINDTELLQLKLQQESMYVALNRVYAWLNTFADYLSDTLAYFGDNPNHTAKFYRLAFNSLSKYSEGILLSYMGEVIDEQNILFAIQNKYILLTNILSIHTDVFSKDLLWQYTQKKISVSEAKSKWKEYLTDRHLEYQTPDYTLRTPITPLK